MHLLRISNKLLDNKYYRFAFISILTFLFSFIAYSYGIFNYSPSHDSLLNFYSSFEEIELKLNTGRIFIPLYRIITRFSLTGITLPVVCWILGTVWLSISNYLILELFNIKKLFPVIILTGLLTVNHTVISLVGRYLHEYEYDMLALLLVTTSFYFLNKGRLKDIIFSCLFLSISLGLYTAYFSTFLTLSILMLIHLLLTNELWKKSGKLLLNCLIVSTISLAVYYVLIKCTNALYKVNSFEYADYNSLNKVFSVFSGLFHIKLHSTCIAFSEYLFSTESRLINPLPMILNVLSIMFAVLLFIKLFLNKNGSIVKKIIASALIIILPVIMTIMHLLSCGISHLLMVYSIWLIYLLFIDLSEINTVIHSKANSVLIIALQSILALILLSNLILSNTFLMKKKIQFDYTNEYLNRVIYRLEDTDGYQEGITPVYFDAIKLKEQFPIMKGFEEIYTFDYNSRSPVTYGKLYSQYFQYFLNVPVNMYNGSLNDNQNKNYKEMNTFPAKDSVRIVEGLVIVKLE